MRFLAIYIDVHSKIKLSLCQKNSLFHVYTLLSGKAKKVRGSSTSLASIRRYSKSSRIMEKCLWGPSKNQTCQYHHRWLAECVVIHTALWIYNFSFRNFKLSVYSEGPQGPNCWIFLVDRYCNIYRKQDMSWESIARSIQWRRKNGTSQKCPPGHLPEESTDGPTSLVKLRDWSVRQLPEGSKRNHYTTHLKLINTVCSLYWNWNKIKGKRTDKRIIRNKMRWFNIDIFTKFCFQK